MFNATFHYFSKETSLIKRTSPSKIRDIYFIYITLSSFIRREKARAPRARIQPKISPLLGEEKRNSRNVEYTLKGDKHNQGTAARHKGTNGPPSPIRPIRISLSSNGRCCALSRMPLLQYPGSRSKSGKGAPTASSKLQLCRNYRAERIAGRRMRDAIVKGGGEGVRLEVPGHLFIAYAPVLLLLLRDDNISWTNRSARHLFFSSLSIHLSLNFFPLLFFLLFSSLFRPLRFVALLSLSLPPSRLVSRSGLSGPLILRIFPLEPRGSFEGRRGIVVTRCPEKFDFRPSFAATPLPLSISLFIYYLVVFGRFCTVVFFLEKERMSKEMEIGFQLRSFECINRFSLNAVRFNFI